MKKKINLRSATKAFEMTLTKFDARDQFVNNWAAQNLLFGEGITLKEWKKIRRYYNPLDWITKAFIWSRTPEGYHYWSVINDCWKNWIRNYINENYEG